METLHADAVIRQAGDVYCNEATAHAVQNLGKTDIHNLVVELKPAALCR